MVNTLQSRFVHTGRNRIIHKATVFAVGNKAVIFYLLSSIIFSIYKILLKLI